MGKYAARILIISFFLLPALAVQGKEIDFFRDIRTGMPAAELTALGASGGKEEARIETVIARRRWQGTCHLKDGALEAVVLIGQSENGPLLEAALREQGLLPVHVEIDGSAFDLAGELRKGAPPGDAMQALVDFLQDAGRPRCMRTTYTDRETLAQLVSRGIAFSQLPDALGDVSVVVVSTSPGEVRVLACASKTLPLYADLSPAD